MTPPEGIPEAPVLDRRAERRQAIIEAGEQMRNGLFGFVAHVREPEGLAFDLAVAAIDSHEVIFPHQGHQLRGVDFTIIFHTMVTSNKIVTVLTLVIGLISCIYDFVTDITKNK